MTRAAPYDRDKTLDRAMQLFWSKGYHATSLKDLEAALDMRPGSIYAAFKSKDTLFRLALERYHARMAEVFEEKLAETESPLQALADWLRLHVERRLRDPAPPACMLAKTSLELADVPGEAGAEARAYLRRVGERFAEVFALARARGELPDSADPERLARLLQAKIMGLTVFLQRETDPEVLLMLADDMAREVLALGHAGTGAPAEHARQG
ncbi:TetR/AcrR family transcriptional regulator [Mangrovicoccus sp. HB161399]|uniref:TetR/AcrR family transcriptional regulator n=1 Tax=Mangrovicoccus sp. HB161399 TaxID=2720392 RepID=UPI001554DB90|nr:TetR/AcrR family transcriptional regulator [Mangrovicoccus sp. HB161399]